MALVPWGPGSGSSRTSLGHAPRAFRAVRAPFVACLGSKSLQARVFIPTPRLRPCLGQTRRRFSVLSVWAYVSTNHGSHGHVQVQLRDAHPHTTIAEEGPPRQAKHRRRVTATVDQGQDRTFPQRGTGKFGPWPALPVHVILTCVVYRTSTESVFMPRSAAVFTCYYRVFCCTSADMRTVGCCSVSGANTIRVFAAAAERVRPWLVTTRRLTYGYPLASTASFSLRDVIGASTAFASRAPLGFILIPTRNRLPVTRS